MNPATESSTWISYRRRSLLSSTLRLSSTLPGLSLMLMTEECPQGAKDSSGGLVTGPQQAIGDRLLEGLPRGGDDVLVHTDRAPLAAAVARLDEHPGDRPGAVRAFEDAHLVVDQFQRRQLGV